MDLKEINKHIAFEILERLYRFLSHLDEIESQFYLSSKNNGKHLLLSSFRESLYTLLWLVIKCYSSNIDIKYLCKCKDTINALHQYLSFLPRPIELVELTRLKRIIQKQIVILNIGQDDQNNISFYVDESLGESINIDPLLEFKFKEINDLINQIDKSKDINSFSNEIDTNKISHITIPRIDSSNPYRWPSLLHEFSHSLLDNKIFNDNKNIIDDFLATIGANHKKDILNAFSFTNSAEEDRIAILRHWLTEVWCDLFATLLIGPSFYFSQYMAFFNQNQSDDSLNIYPPATFRLFLIDRMINRRFEDLYPILENQINDCELIINSLKSESIKAHQDQLIKLQQYFHFYFNSHFFKKDSDDIDSNDINTNLKKIVKEYSLVNTLVISRLKEQLETGIPIPSIALNDLSKYRERPTTVQEIFLSAWLNRLDSIKASIIQILDTKNLHFGKLDDVISFYKENVKYKFFRLDQAILKSIQVSEWFDLYYDDKEKSKVKVEDEIPYEYSCGNKSISHHGILVDFEIKLALFSKQIQIVPLMNLEEQLGTTSMDIRLGTTFELFFQNQYGIIDYSEEKVNKHQKEFSKRVNLDFPGAITISPGQFLLAHSMEYIKLSDYICAEIEGRSSFARLGIEVHMTAGFIDPGFEGVITLEMSNTGTLPVKLYPGMRIGQLRFSYNSLPENRYSQRHHVKYKGLLEHHNSKQSNDIEIDIIKRYKDLKKK